MIKNQAFMNRPHVYYESFGLALIIFFTLAMASSHVSTANKQFPLNLNRKIQNLFKYSLYSF